MSAVKKQRRAAMWREHGRRVYDMAKSLGVLAKAGNCLDGGVFTADIKQNGPMTPDRLKRIVG